MSPQLRLESVAKRFAGASPVQALRQASLTIEQGEFVAIKGASGSGKSTLLNIVGTLDRPSSGHYLIDGTDVTALKATALARLRSRVFAFVFQSFHLLDRRYAIDSVELGMLYQGIPPGERRTRALAAMREFGIERLAFTRSNRLSGGERQRVALARALASNASIVIADEPTGNLDSENAELVVESLLRLNKQGVTVILVTHSDEVAAVASRQIQIRDGQTLAGYSRDGYPRDGNALSVDEPARPVAAARSAGILGRAERPGDSSWWFALADMIRDGFANVASRPGKTAGLVAAVALGVALAIGSSGVSSSARAQVSDRFNAHTNRDVTLKWQPEELAGLSVDEQTPIPTRLAQLPGVDAAALLTGYDPSQVRTNVASQGGAQLTSFSATKDIVRAGRLGVVWGSSQHTLGPGQVLLGETVAKQLYLAPVTLGPTIFVGDHPMLVVGLIRDSPRIPELTGSVVLSDKDAGLLSQANTVTGLVLTQLGAAQQLARQAPLVVNPYSPGSVEVSAPIDPRTLRSEVEATVGITLLTLTGIALLAATVGLANAMVLAVIERRQEFGLRRAVGAKTRHIFSLVLVESGLIGLMGGFIGLITGFIGVLVVTISQHWIPVLDLSLAPVSVAGGLVVGGLGGLVAAIRAARIQPSDALRL